MFANPLISRLADFVREIGIPVRSTSLPGDTFLAGLDIRDGILLVDEESLKYPGDLLHEAGHIAVADEPRRFAPVLKPTKAEEMAAIAWSYAAIRHVGLPAEVVFHGQGYQGGGGNLLEAFEKGCGPGIPMLAWFGLTVDPNGPEADGKQTFPHMNRWVR